MFLLCSSVFNSALYGLFRACSVYPLIRVRLGRCSSAQGVFRAFSWWDGLRAAETQAPKPRRRYFDLEAAREHLPEKIPHFDELAILVVDPDHGT